MWCDKKKMKKLDRADWILMKLSLVAFVLFLITVPNPSKNILMQWVHAVHWGWFLGIAILLRLRPWKRMYM